MKGKKRGSRRSLGSDLARVDAHIIQPEEYEELPELTDEMLARGVWKRGGSSFAKATKRRVRSPGCAAKCLASTSRAATPLVLSFAPAQPGTVS